MICHFVEQPAATLRALFEERYQPLVFERRGASIAVLSSKVQKLDEQFASLFSRVFVAKSDIQLASRSYQEAISEVGWGGLSIGGDRNSMALIAGPCSVESREQLWAVCEVLAALGVRSLRGGAFKPRTSPYSFQGLGNEGLRLLSEARRHFGFSIVSEVRDSTHVEQVLDTVDVVQVGAKAMYDQGILRACGRAKKPVLLKRGFGSTLQEFVQAAEFILSLGNDQVMLCERGIRTFESKTRFTLDLCGVEYLKEHTNLPVIVDPSHAMGFRYGVPALARAATALGVDGLLIETHPCPTEALSDAAQQLDLNQFAQLKAQLAELAPVLGKTLV